MKRWSQLTVGAVLVWLISLNFPQAFAQSEAGNLRVQSVAGDATYTLDGQGWQKLTADTLLPRGSAIRAGHGAAVDLVMEYNGTVLRLMSDSSLRVAKLVKEQAGPDIITETSLELDSGALLGSQRKLRRPSRFDIQIPGGVATIRGTEYVVNADGAVTVLSGEVSINYNLPKAQGSVRTTIAAGQSFDPATGAVVPTTPDYLENVIADIDTLRNNAQVFKAAGATIVIKPSNDRMSPTQPNKGNNGVGNGEDPPPPGNPPVNDGPGTGPGNPGNRK